MNKVMFTTINNFTKSINNGDSLVQVYHARKIFLNHNYGQDEHNVVCENLSTYQEIAEKYISEKNHDGNTYYMIGNYQNKGKVLISTRYNKGKKSVKIEILYIFN